MPNAAPRPAEAIAGRLSLANPDSHIRRLTAADVAFCRALFHAHRGVQFAPLGLGDDVLRAMLDQQFNAQQIGYAQRFPNAEQFIIEHAGAAVGRLIVSLERPAAALAAAQLPEGPTLHLVDITISAAARRRGIGSDVIASLARAGDAVGVTRFTLVVLQSNEAARRLYERLGFVAAGDGAHVLMVRESPAACPAPASQQPSPLH